MSLKRAGRTQHKRGQGRAKTIRKICGIEAVGWTADVGNGRITRFKTTVKIAFVVEDVGT